MKKSMVKILSIMLVMVITFTASTYFHVNSVSAAATGTIKVYNVKDFPGSDTVAIQAAIDQCSTDGGGIVYFPSGTYLITSTIIIKSNVTLLGDGTTSKLKADSTLPDSSGLILNETTTGLKDTYYDNNIKISQLVFEGNSSTSRTSALINIMKATQIIVDDCSFQNNYHMGLAISGSYVVQIQNSRFFNLGRPKPSTVSAPGIWIGTNGLDGSTSKSITIDNSFFTNNNWAGCYFVAYGGIISNSTFINNSEAGIFTWGSDLQFIDNYISGTTRSNISSSGIECGGVNVLMQGNQIKNCQSSGISLTDTQNVIVSNNMINGNGQDPVYFPTAAGISVITTETTEGKQPNNISIHDNRVMDTQTVKTQSYGIGVGGTGLAAKNISIYDNNLRDFKTAALDIDGAKWGTNSYTENNLGHSSVLPRIGEFLAPSTNGSFSITGIGFRPRRLEFRATLAGGQVYESESVFTEDVGLLHYRAIAAGGGAVIGSILYNKAIALYTNTGTKICEATLASRDIDGFTLTFTDTTYRPYVIWIAYP